MSELASYWMHDQSLSFAAALLSGNPNSIATAMAETCVDLIRDKLFDNVFALSDTTLSLIASIGDAYDNPDYLRNEGLEGLVERSNVIGSARETARKELLLRESTAGAKLTNISRVLVSHAVYVLKQRHLSASKFFKWLQRSGGVATPGIETIVRNIKRDPGNLDQRLSKLLDDSRDTLKQTRDRIDQIDNLYEVVLTVANGDAEKIRPWWAQICLGYRNSLFCWPLMVYRSPGGDETRGISLPIPLFLFEDGGSTHEKTKRNVFGQKTWFKWVTSRGAERSEGDKRYQPPRDSVPAHMEDSRLGWDMDWGSALQIGMDVAKKLWDSQNGRLKYADEEQAQAKLTASLNVDLAPASQIVDSVYGRVPPEYFKAVPEEERYFRLEGGSAEAYWVQAVLGLLLPAREIPLGVVTGRIIYADGAYELGDVQGIKAKLEYAHRAGFPRIVVPGSPEDYSKFDAEEEGLPAYAADADKDSRVLLDDAFQAERETASDPLTPKKQVKLFLDTLKIQDTSKSIEINFCKNARAAADAMQPSGWRRATVLRLPQLQLTYGYNQRRLFCREIVRKGEHLRREDRNWYFHGGNRWEEYDSRHMEGLDDILLSETGRAIKFVKRSSLIGKNGNAEATIGKWLAWKDNQVRTGDGIGYKGPGLGILCLRTTEHDNEFRILAAIADLLDVDPDWWERFQWSPRSQAASMLAGLFNNQRANLSISASSAPDVVVIFDDGGFTQRRTNRIFPSDFNHEFLDLLNPRKDVPGAWDPLDSAFKSQGDGPIGPTRIIVVYGDDGTSSDAECEIDEGDRRLLEKLSVFRFGCPKQAAYSMLNFGTIPSERLTWVQAQVQLDQLVKKKLLRRNRNLVFLPGRVAKVVARNPYENDPKAHLHAARALCPILHPSGHFIASNRDRQLEPEPVLEAAWHLQRAYALVPNRFRPKTDPASAAKAMLTFLRSSPDWDTVKRLRVNRLTRRDAVELARELIATELAISGNQPHSSRIGLMVETIGRLYANEPPSSTEREEQAQQITDIVEQAIREMPPTFAADRRRQMRFLLSRQIYCFRKLGVPLSDTRLAGPQAYMETSNIEVLDATFLASIGEDFQGLDDFPISRDYWRCMWSNDKQAVEHDGLTLKQRSTNAYVAARTNLGRDIGGNEVRAPWDEPWIQYFKFASVGDIGRDQLKNPLETWNSVYGQSEASAEEFGRRILMMNVHVRTTKAGYVPGWSKDIGSAVGNVWDYLVHPDPTLRLYGPPVDHALKLIQVIAIPETLPAYCFVERCGGEFHDRWPQEAQKELPDGWRSLAREIVATDAGWVSMLASLTTSNELNPSSSVKRVRAWLFAHCATARDGLRFSDPESLIHGKKLDTARDYEQKRTKGLWNGFQVLAQRNDEGWAVYGFLRQKLLSILLEADRKSNSWFFALADNKPDVRTLAGARLMIQHAEVSAVPQLMHEGLSHKRQQFLRNMKGFAKMATRRERESFDRVIQIFEGSFV